MSASHNRVSLIGNLGADPEIRTTQNGDRVANFSIATSERWADKQTGEIKERTEWHRINTWNAGLIDKLIEPHMRKGSKVFVTGALRTRKWTDQAGVERYSTEIETGRIKDELILFGNPNGQRNTASGDQETPSYTGSNIDDDEVPF